MAAIKGLRARLPALLHRGAAERDLDEELRFHLDMETEKNVRAGMHPAEARRRDRLDDEAQALAKRIEETPIVIHARTGEGGRLYGSVTSSDIAEALSTEMGATIDKRNVDLGEPIRHLGTHTARIHVAPRVTVPLSVQVEPE